MTKDIEALTERVKEAIERLEACTLSSEDEEKIKINTMTIRVNRIRRKTRQLLAKM